MTTAPNPTDTPIARLTPEQREDLFKRLKAEHGEVYLIDGKPITDDAIVIRPAGPAEWRIFVQKVRAEDPEAGLHLVQMTCVYPKVASDLQAIIDLHPALGTSWGREAQAISGALVGEHRRKL